ncbi:SCO1860 family LAETG-anchored protein [Streptomyces sp. NPDC001744]|uniref:SCO1860 family LAETG-anchored protein n=1 Tax=Streptomyces sp. NPDC001744 TaxID=3364606 RepID=UPI0036BE5428
MNSTTFRMPARRSAAAAAVAALAAGPVLLAAPPAHAAGGEGRATAVVLRAGLDVSLLGEGVTVPVRASLNEVEAPGTASGTALSLKVRGAEGGRPVDVLTADVATSGATADEEGAEGHVNLAKARVHVPGLPLLSLVEVEKVASRALCVVGAEPVAESNVLGHVTVLGRKTTLSTAGRTRVAVPGVGEVTLDLSRTSTTSRTAAATALELRVRVDPLELGVARVEGTVTLAGATCETPAGAMPTEKPTQRPTGRPSEQPAAPPAAGPGDGDGGRTGSGGPAPAGHLAETGGGSATPYVAAGALALVVAGGGALALTRSRARSRG